MKYLIEQVQEILENHGIECKIDEVNGFKFIYVQHGGYGRPSGLKIKKREFRPDFRISVHDDDPDGLLYTRVCGYVSYMTMEEILEELIGAA